jgi:hypothetical protein
MMEKQSGMVVFTVRVSHLNGARDRETAMSAIVKELERAQQGFDKSCESIKDGKFSTYDMCKGFQPFSGFELTNDSPNY